MRARRFRPLLLSLALLAAVSVSLAIAPGPNGLFGAFLAILMLTIATVDARRYIIPNELTAAALALALLRAGMIGLQSGLEPALGAMIATAFGALATAAPFWILMILYRRVRGRDGLGFGDVKLAAVAGAWLGWVTIFAVVELATLSALGVYILISFVRRRPMKATAMLPFGLFLAPAIWAGWLIEAIFS
jgi:leader peptidase (prepilin peptidase) / N-methyltransferase